MLQTKLPSLLGLLLRKGYVAHPQILFGAIGDATCDRAPLQIGQFESDNRMDEDLGRILLEGGGGGQQTESYELAMYFMARHTSIDCFDKRGRRGYLFIIGDEMPYRRVKQNEVRRIIGDDLAEDISTEAIVAELKRRYHVYYILPAGSSYVGDATILSTGETCSVRTSSSWTTSTPCARPSRSRSGWARRRLISTRVSTIWRRSDRRRGRASPRRWPRFGGTRGALVVGPSLAGVDGPDDGLIRL